jgi:hypothetical protein
MVVTIDTDFNVPENWPNLSYVTVFFFSKSLFSILYDFVSEIVAQYTKALL